MYNFLMFLINAFQIIIVVYFIVKIAIYTIFQILSFKSIYDYSVLISQTKIKMILANTFYRPISIIVPAYNEQETIIANIYSLIRLHYPEFELIVVNDGSKDETLKRIINEFKMVRIDKPIKKVLKHQEINGIYVSESLSNLILVNKKNGGKADALNAGINISKYPIFCSIDADSLLENDSLLRAINLFLEHKEMIAVGGVVKILNGCTTEEGIVKDIKAPKNIIEAFQCIEYVRGFLSGRTTWNTLGNSLMIISGAFGIFRKDLVVNLGGYRATIGEDMDLVVRLHKHCRLNKIPYKIFSIPVPVCFTQVPSNINALIKQRNRWHRGLIDSLLHSKTIFFNPRYGSVGMLAFPYFVFIEAFGPFVEIIGYIGLVFLYIFGYLSFEFALLFFIVSILWGMLLNLSSILLDTLLYRKYADFKSIILLCIYGFLENLGYRQLLLIDRFLATFQFTRKKWDKAERKTIEVSRFN
ncbi:MAG: glycosyltransferase family 2 protein [Candidatus Sericytochromatia bacterium]